MKYRKIVEAECINKILIVYYLSLSISGATSYYLFDTKNDNTPDDSTLNNIAIHLYKSHLELSSLKK